MDQDNRCYTIITFAPIQAFIEKSRKLRDLYGSSYILSFLSWIICLAAEKQGYSVVSPALPNVTQGMPNQIVLQGNLSPEDIQAIHKTFNQAWKCVVNSCREWIEKNVTQGKDAKGDVIQWDYRWQRDWQLWTNHCWEFFSATGQSGESITQVRQRLNQVKNSRDWTGINWQGESSTLSGTDAIAYPGLGHKVDPRCYDYQQERAEVRAFYQQLAQELGKSFINATPELRINEENQFDKNKEYGSSFVDPREELSIPELIKRLITHKVIVEDLVERLGNLTIVIGEDNEPRLALFRDLNQITQDLRPDSFRDLNREKDDESEEKYETCWFLGDGDNASRYFQNLAKSSSQVEQEKLTQFSKEMREWGRDLCARKGKSLPGIGRMIYAGGDDFFGVLYYPGQQISPRDCLRWFYTFKSEIWQQPKPKKITPSVGFVWAGSQIPQRDVLQHCKLAEKSAKSTGRDRIAFRILFNSGNFLEWVCPWWLLDKLELANVFPSLPKADHNLIESYRGRNQSNNWTHLYQDVALLESRHAFNDQQIDIALALIEIYFGTDWQRILADRDNWWNRYDNHELQTFSGVLGDPKRFQPNYQENPKNRKAPNTDPKAIKAFNFWVINLSKIGFYLTAHHERTIKPPVSPVQLLNHD